MTGKTFAQRVAFWDNAKLFMLFLVIFGHAIEPFYSDGSVVFGVWLVIYLVHMPIMMFISGYFSGDAVTEKAKLKAVELLVLYIMWEILFALIRFAFFGYTPTTNFLVKPSFAMWFILALFLMRILLPYVLMLKYPLLMSILFATLIPFAPGLSSYFTLTRMFTFMPFFVAGYLLANGNQKINDIVLNPTKTMKIISATFLAALTTIFIFWSNLKETYIGPWLYRREGYKKLSVGTEDLKPVLQVDYEESLVLFSAASIGLSIIFLIVTFLASAATLILVPRKGSFVSRFGSKTLYIYLLHIPIIWSLNHLKIPASFYYTYGLKALLLIAVLSLILTFVLGSKMVTLIFKPIVEPNISFLVKSDKKANIRKTSGSSEF